MTTSKESTDVLARIDQYLAMAAPVSYDRIRQAIFDSFNQSKLEVADLSDITVSKRKDGAYAVTVVSNHSDFLVNEFLAARARVGHRFKLRGQIKVSSVQKDPKSKPLITYTLVVKEINTDKV